MPIKGIVLILIVAIVIALAFKKDIIAFIESNLNDDKNNENKNDD